MSQQQTQQIPNDTRPVVGAAREKELVFLIDTSGSMEWEIAEGSPITRHQLLNEAILPIIGKLEDLDSQKSKEQSGGSTEKGGALTFGFSDRVQEVGDLNTDNFEANWKKIVWGGGTAIMPAYNAAVNDFMEEFANTSPMDLPAHILVVFTDGEAQDAKEFEKVMSDTAAAKTPRYVVVCTLGHGPEHDKIVNEYQDIAKNNPHVRVLIFGGNTSPSQIADDVLATVGA